MDLGLSTLNYIFQLERLKISEWNIIKRQDILAVLRNKYDFSQVVCGARWETFYIKTYKVFIRPVCL